MLGLGLGLGPGLKTEMFGLGLATQGQDLVACGLVDITHVSALSSEIW